MEVCKHCIVEEEQNAKEVQRAREITLGTSLVSERNRDGKKRRKNYVSELELNQVNKLIRGTGWKPFK